LISQALFDWGIDRQTGGSFTGSMDTYKTAYKVIGKTPAGSRRRTSSGQCTSSGQYSYSFALVPFLLGLAFIWPFHDGTKVEMMAGKDTSAARGTITIKNGANGNVALDIKAASLASPNSLTPPENAYVVWLQRPGQEPQNLGEFRVDKKESGELHTETAFKRFKIFITAEQNAQTEVPQGPSVLSADVSGTQT
jgi:hypothetical protein